MNLVMPAVPLDPAKNRGTRNLLGSQELYHSRIHGLNAVAIVLVDEDSEQPALLEPFHLCTSTNAVLPFWSSLRLLPVTT